MVWVTVVQGGARCVEAAGKNIIDLPSSTSFGGHCWFHEGSTHPPRRNGALGSLKKLPDFKTHFSRRIVKTLTVDLCQTRSYFQVTISNC